MVLPILGLLAAGTAAALQPYARNRNNRIAGEYLTRRAVEAGLDLDTATPDQMRTFGLEAGLLGMPDAQRDSRTAFEGAAQRQQSDINSRRAAGTAAARLAFDRERAAAAEAAAAAQERLQRDAMAEAGYDPNSALSRMQVVRDAVFGAEGDARSRTIGADALANDGRPSTYAEWWEADQARREQEAAAQAEFNAVQSQIQPLIDQQDRYRTAIEALPNVTFNPQYKETTAQRDARLYVSQSLDMLRSRYWTEILNRSDAPAAEELKQLLAAVPNTDDGWFTDDRRRATVARILELAEREIAVQGMQVRDRVAGRPATSYRGRVIADSEWRGQ